MRLGTVKRADGKTQAFRQDESGTYYYDFCDVAELIRQEDWESLSAESGDAPSDAQLTAPILSPKKILCIGLNYHDHAAEVGKVAPEFPTIFSRVATSLTGPRDIINYPKLSQEIDWEAELAVVIGKEVKEADDQEALDSILGYTVFNDISMRDWQRRTPEWFQGKNFDGTSPLGPVIVTKDVLDPAAGLRVETIVNESVEQSGSTSQMIFSVVEVVKYISQFLTLEPGDIIATGTPAGVGAGQNPKKFLSPGDVLTTRIEGIGELINSFQ